MTYRKHTLRIAATVSVALLAATLLWPSARPPRPVGAADTAAADSAAALGYDLGWAEHLRTEAGARFLPNLRVEDVAPNAPAPVTRPLDATDRSAVAALLASMVSLRREDLQRFQQSLSPSSIRDAFEEASLLLDMEVARAAQIRLLTDDFVVLASGEEVPPTADNFQLVLGIRREGKPANALFLFPPANNPNLHSLRDYRSALESAWIDDVVTRFNQKPLDERAALVRHRDAYASSPNTSTPEDLAVMREWFPPQLRIDPQSFRLARP